jgi:hypothetical protein
VTELLHAAFAALGPGASRGEVALVASALRNSGDEPTLAMFRPRDGAYFDHASCDAVTDVAVRAGAGGLVALDLYTEMVRPGWSPFPHGGAEDREN